MALTINPCKNLVALGQKTGIVKIFPLEIITDNNTQNSEPSFYDNKAHGQYDVTIIGWMINGSKLATGSEDGTIIVWEQIDQNQWQVSKKLTLKEEARQLTFSPDGQKLGICTVNEILIYDLCHDILVNSYPGYFKNGAASFEKNWKFLALPSIAANVMLFDLQKYQNLRGLTPEELKKLVFHKNHQK